MALSFGCSADDIFFNSHDKRIEEVHQSFGDYLLVARYVENELVGFELTSSQSTSLTTNTIAEAQSLFRSNGLLEGGSLYNPGQPITPDGVSGPSTRRAFRLFQALVLHDGNDGTLDGLLDDISPGMLNIVRRFENCLLWSQVDQNCTTVVDWPAPAGDIYDGYGSQAWAGVLRSLAVELGHPLAVNDVSLPAGGPFVSCTGQMLHETHQAGVDMDFPLPAIDGSLRRLTWQDRSFDRERMRGFLNLVRDRQIASHVWFNDPALIAEGLCLQLQYHDDHAHVRLRSDLPKWLTIADQDYWWNLITGATLTPQNREMLNCFQSFALPNVHPTRRHLYTLPEKSLVFVDGIPLVAEDDKALILAVEHRRVVGVAHISVERRNGALEFTVHGTRQKHRMVPTVGGVALGPFQFISAAPPVFSLHRI